MRNWIPVLAVVVLLGGACSGPSGQTGSLTVNLKDGPYADAMAMLVTFSGVSAHHADAEWQPLKFAGEATTLTCDLKKLVNAFDVLGTGQLLAGHYTQLRVVVESAALYSSPTPVADPACAATHDAAWRSHGQRRDPIRRSEAQSTIHDTGGWSDEDPPRLRWRSVGERNGQRSVPHDAGHYHPQR